MAKGIYGPWTTIDIGSPGHHVGVLNVPFASTRSAYQNIQVPLASIRGGNGAPVLLTGGIHGDEYEGQVALDNLIRKLEPDELNTGVVIMPAANLPASQSAARISPLDGGNLNSAFPGKEDGGPTDQIAHFIETKLLPHVSAWIDIHTGGTSLEYTPMAAIHSSEDLELDKRALAALKAFGAPLSTVFCLQHEYAASSAAQRHGLIYIYGEFGGGGTVNPEAVDIVSNGIIRLLDHFGVLCSVKRFNLPQISDFRLVETVTGSDYIDTRRNYVFSPCSGLFVSSRRLNEEVRKGQLLGHIHLIEQPLEIPKEVCFEMSGLLIAKRHPARVEPGDCLAQIAIDREN